VTSSLKRPATTADESGVRFTCALAVSRRLAVTVLAVAVAGSAAQAARAFSITGKPWRSGTITYYNRAPDQQWAISRAVNAWNASGANVRFVAVSDPAADVVIQHLPTSDCATGGMLGEAVITRNRNAVVFVRPLDDGYSNCSRWTAATTLAHELGHVLGLGHETRGCAVMNPRADVFGPTLCPRPAGFEWRCQLLSQDDVAGAVRMYGGFIRPLAAPEMCPLYPQISSPRTLAVEFRPDEGGVRLAFPRPSEPPLPAFITKLFADDPPGLVRGGFAYLRTTGRCATQRDVSSARRIHWNAGTAVGALTTFVDRPPRAGKYCYAMWALDRANTPSARPTLAVVTIP